MTKTIFWLSVMTIVTVLVAGSIVVGPIAFADNNGKDHKDNKERVSVTTQLTNSGDGGVTVLLDTTGSGFLKTVHVAATLPSANGCTNTPPDGGLAIVAGIAGVTIPSAPLVIISSGAENTGFPGDATHSCVFHATVTAPTPHAITDIVLVNGVLDGQTHVTFPAGTTVTVTGTYE